LNKPWESEVGRNDHLNQMNFLHLQISICIKYHPLRLQTDRPQISKGDDIVLLDIVGRKILILKCLKIVWNRLAWSQM